MHHNFFSLIKVKYNIWISLVYLTWHFPVAYGTPILSCTFILWLHKLQHKWIYFILQCLFKLIENANLIVGKFLLLQDITGYLNFCFDELTGEPIPILKYYSCCKFVKDLFAIQVSSLANIWTTQPLYSHLFLILMPRFSVDYKSSLLNYHSNLLQECLKIIIIFEKMTM